MKTTMKYLSALVVAVALIAFTATLHAQTISTMAGSPGSPGYSGDGSSAVSAQINGLVAIASDAAGNVYIADNTDNVVRKVNTSGIISTVAGSSSGSAGSSGDGGPATAALLNVPSGLAFDGAGNLYIADLGNNKIRKIAISTGVITTVVGNGSATYAGDGLPATSSSVSLNNPTALTFDPAGNMYIVDQANYRIRKVNTSGIIYTICGNGTGAHGGDGSAASAATISSVTGIAVDAAGNIYLAEYGTQVVRYINTSGIINTYAGTLSSSGTGGDGGAATSATIDHPIGLWMASSGDLFIAEQYGHRIRKVNTTTGIITTAAGTTAGFSGDGGAAVSAQLSFPSGVTLDGAGNFYIADYGNYVIRKVSSTCSGTPSVGSVVPSVSFVCGSSTSFSLGLTGTSSSTSITYQWQSSPDNSTWSNITGATVTPYGTTQSASTYYRCVLTCPASSSSNTSASTFIGFSTACYCRPSFQDSTNSCYTYYMGISHFNVNGESGTSINDYTACNGHGYIDRTTLSVNLEQSYSYTASIYHSGTYNMNVQAWIDYDDDGTFSSSESVGGTNNYGTAGTFVITPIMSATVGNHTMRVITCYTSSGGAPYPSIDPCAGGYLYGDSRDFTVNIVPLPTCSGTPSPGTVSTTTAQACPSTPFTLTLTSFSAASSLVFQWQSSPDSVSWTSISGATSSIYVTTESAVTYFRCQVTCTATSTSAYSPGRKIDYIGYCYCTPSFAQATISCSMYNFAINRTHTIGASGTSITDNNVCTGAGYEDYTAMSVTYIQGQNYLDTIVSSTGSASYTLSNQIWIDFNNNGTFETTEKVGGKSRYVGNPAIAADTISIPSSAAPGTHRMRVLQDYTGTDGIYPSIDPCASGYQYGEARDYTVIIANPAPVVSASPTTIAFGTVATGSCSILPCALTGSYLTPSSGNLTVTASTAAYKVCSTSTGTFVTSYVIAYTGGAAFGNVYVQFCPTSTGASFGCINVTGGGLATTYCIAVNGSGAGPCTGTPSGGSATATPNNGGGSTAFALALTGATVGSGISYQWKSCPTISGTYTAITGATNATYNFTGITANTYYECTLLCSYTSASATSNPVLITFTGCSGTVSAGTSTSTSTYVTSSATSFTLGLTGTSAGSDLTYQWQSSTDNTTWSNISGATSSTLATTESVSTFYRCIVACAASSSAANSIPVLVSFSSSAYCTPAFVFASSSCSGGSCSAMSQFHTNGFSGTSINDNAACTGTGYQDKTALSVSYLQNTTYYATVIAIACATGSAGLGNQVWIDFNSNGVFESSETVGYRSGYTGTSAVGLDTLTIPAGAATGVKRMRVVQIYNAAGHYPPTYMMDPCTAGYYYGEARDYTVVIVGGSCTGTPTAGSISASVTSSCTVPFSSTLTVTGASSGAGITYQWQSSSDSASWSPISGATSTVYSANVTSSPTYYRLLVTCSASGISSGVGIKLGLTPAPSTGAITGPATVCIGANATLTDPVSGGTWTSSDNSIATVNSGGIVHGVAGGSVIITYTVTNACSSAFTTYTMTVLPVVAPITGSTTSVCMASSITLSDATSGGTWSSTASGVATVSPTGVVTGITVGSTTISYLITGSCGSVAATTTVTVITVPSVPAITGSSSVCTGGTTTLSNATSGGTWSSATSSLATVEATTGVVHGIALGTATISYTVTNACGTSSASTFETVTTVTSVAAITGPTAVCVAHVITLACATTGGTWSTASGTAGVDASSGVVTGYSAGTAVITYTVTGACGTSFSTYTVTINPLPTAGTITGTLSACAGGGTTSLSDATSGGVWTSSNTSIATVVSTTGLVTGVAGGSVNISYSVSNSCGTNSTFVSVTITPLPSAGTIAGSTTVCVSTTSVMADTATGGVWSSSNASVATIDPSTGLLTGVSSGTANITYTVTNACGSARVSTPVTVNSAPSAGTITGASSVCATSTITLTDGVSGGTWSSSNTAIATVNSSGVVRGVAAGSVVISYTATSSCGTATATKTITVNAMPSAGTITGSLLVCSGATITLSDTATGGTWSSSNTTIATVGSATGIVTGISGGTTNISYTVTNGCGTASVGVAVSVTALPSAGTITGSTSVCIGATTTLADATSGGTWSTSNTTVATVSATGVVTGVSAGTDSVLYSVSNSCGTATAFLIINSSVAPSAGTITGISAICQGAVTTLSDAVSGGTWSSANTAVATVNSSGAVTGVSAGNVLISYTITGTCGSVSATKLVLVTGLPSAGTITGTLNVCIGGTSVLSDTAAGGTWSTSASSIASITSSGIMTGVAAGSATISYTKTNSCGSAVATATANTQVSPVAGTITGTTLVCAGATTTLSDASAGGVWSSTASGIATVDPATGVVTGVAAGSATISYTVTNACGSASTSTGVTVDPAVSAGTITGTNSVCPGSTTALADAVSGGSWSSSNTAVATVNSTGLVSGVTPGTAVISYSVTNTCGTASALDTVTVNNAPSAGTITGVSAVCTGATTTLADAISGGTWTSSNTAIATVNASGVVRGVTGGSVTISYTVTNSCGSATSTLAVTVNTTPSAGTISGATTVCVGATTTLVDAVSGGTWSSSNTTIATINSSGTVRGIAAGTVTISYIITTSCGTGVATQSFTVTTSGSAGTITGTTALCTGSSSTLADAVTGGTWASSNTSIATISPSGVVRGVSNGSATISYTVTSSCGTATATTTVTVSSTPSAGTITGTPTVCAGSTTTLADAVAGGTWSSSNTSVASVNASGVVSGVSAGSATITYTVVFSCGTATTTMSVTVNPLPAAGTISGTSTVCTGSTVTLTDAAAGGTWTSSNAAIATVTATGDVTGVSVGSATISYTVTTACGTATATAAITVVSGASAGTITGTTTFCQGATSTLADAVSGGTWTSGNTAVATVSASGVVVGVSGGTSIISYGIASSCGTAYATTTVTVNPLPSAGTITGTSAVCVGSTTTLADAVAGGVWTSSNNTIATVGTTGIVTGVASGSVTISYTVTNACGSSTTTNAVTVGTAASAGTITGTTSICLSTSSTLSDAVTGGTWSSSNTAIATVDAGGVVSGVSAGSATISYTVTGACGAVSATIPVTIISGVSAGTITGTTTFCAGTSNTLTDAAAGGTWSTSDATVASVDASGVVTGVSGGTATISYVVSSSCGSATATTTVTISPLPAVGTIFGINTVCTGMTTTLTDGASGGSWSSSNTSVATINASGVVTGVAAGTSVISYSATNSCGTAAATDTVTVNAMPTAGFISGGSSVCTGSTITLTDAAAGGTWSSSNVALATVDASGVVSGVAAGSVTISYTVTNSCGTANATTSITVISGSAGTITGTTSVCIGTTSTLADAVAGGSWSSSNNTIATVSSTGVVTGVGVGSCTITYLVTTSCGASIATTTVTVSTSATAGTITGASSVCVGSSTTLSDAVTGGTWSSSNVAVATVDASGSVTGVAAGSVTISYTITGTCGTVSTTAAMTVSTGTSAGTITGASTVCTGSSITLADATTGGTWSSSNPSVATVNSTGDVTGVSVGSVTISYTVSSSCGSATATASITVGAGASAGTISGSTTVCAGATSMLAESVSGGTWSSSNPSVATVSTSGDVTGVAAGTATVSYTVTSSCGATSATAAVVVNPMPSAGTITGTSVMCTGSTYTMTDAVAGGTWSSSNPSIASINTSGVVSAIAAGSATISYSVTNSCGTAVATAAITVSSSTGGSAGTISGVTSVCTSTTTSLSASMSGGTWSSSNIAVATVDAAGVVTGVSSGSVTISYVIGGACGTAVSTIPVTVNPAPAAGTISGIASICLSSPTTGFTSSASGGTWSSSNTSVATISTSGTATGLTVGSATISYTVTNSCGTATAVLPISVTNTATAGSITGSNTVCVGSATTLSDATAGGVWSSSNPSIATVNTSGSVTGVAAGSATITYTVASTCGSANTIKSMTVSGMPSAGTISGTGSLCVGSAATLTESVSGGAWSSSNTAVVAISTSGVVTGVAAGAATISYTVTSGSGCTGVATHTVIAGTSTPTGNVTPGSATLCGGSPVTLSVASSSTALYYQWYKNGTIITGATNATYSATTAGAYNTIISNGCANTALTAVTVAAPPTPVISLVGTHTLTTGSFAAYQWYKNSTAISGATNSSYVFSTSGVYTVRVTDGNGCSVTSAGHTVSGGGGTGGGTGVNPVTTADDVNIYPNPATSIVHINSPVKVNVVVFTAIGKMVMEQKDATEIDMSNLANGLYMIMVYDENNALIKASKLLKAE